MSDRPIPHGTTTGYARGCRCDECRSALAAYQRERQAAMRSGRWVPWANRPAPKMCTGPECERTARYITPAVLCGGHMQQHRAGKTLTPLIRKRFRRADGTKECSRCGRVLPAESFYIASPTKRHGTCADCTAIASRAHRYGLSFDAMKQMMESPCAGCGATDLTGRDLHIDHCHDSGKVRGVLCRHCNAVLMERMTPETLRRLADYLEGT